MRPEVSVLITVYNARELVINLIRSIYRHTIGVSFEIVVVDDGSTDNLTILRSMFPAVNIVVLPENVGYVRANNEGLRWCRGKYILLLNSDIVLVNNAIERMFSFMESEEEAVICGGRLKDQVSYGDEPSLLQAFSNAFFLNRLFKGLPNNGVIDTAGKTREVGYICGADMMVSRSLVDQIGLFDERFEAYSEDADLCKRAREFGRVFFLPVEIVHLGGGVYKGKKRIKLQRESYEKFLLKYHGWIYTATCRMLYALHYSLKGVVRFIDSRPVEAREAWQIVRYSL